MTSDPYLQSSKLSHRTIKSNEKSHTRLSSPDSSTIHLKTIITYLPHNSMEHLRSKTRTLSLNHSTDIPVIHIEISQRQSSCLTSSPTTSKYPNEAALEDESNTRLSSPNSNSRSKLLPSKQNESLNNIPKHSNLNASKEVLSQRWLPGIISIQHTVPTKSLLVTPRRPFFAHTKLSSRLPTTPQPKEDMATDKSLQQASTKLFFPNSNPKSRSSKHKQDKSDDENITRL